MPFLPEGGLWRSHLAVKASSCPGELRSAQEPCLAVVLQSAAAAADVSRGASGPPWHSLLWLCREQNAFFFFSSYWVMARTRSASRKASGFFFCLFVCFLLGAVLKAVTLGKVNSNKGQAGGLKTRKFSISLLWFGWAFFPPSCCWSFSKCACRPTGGWWAREGKARKIRSGEIRI